jgi:hypothetical protein
MDVQRFIFTVFFFFGTMQDIKFAVHAHPTLSEVLDELFKSAKVSILYSHLNIIKAALESFLFHLNGKTIASWIPWQPLDICSG